MSLHKDIQAQIKDAMKAKDEVRLTTIRGLVSAFTNELVAKGRKPQEELADEEVITVIRRGVKQRKDSIEQFTGGGRPELAASEAAELKILEAFLPAQMNAEDVAKIVAAKKVEIGITDKKDAGKLMAAVMKDLKGKADGTIVKAAVDASF